MPLAYGSVALVLVVIVVSLAYATAAPSFGVAEFAPTGRQVEAPPSTDSPMGARGGSAGARARRATTTTIAVPASPTGSSLPASSAPTTQLGRTRDCVGSPPRQTEDPMSPPCVAVMFEGDNGGATTRGVTGTEIKVAVESGFNDNDGALQALFDYFNLRYEFYGRRLVPVVMSYGLDDPVRQRATAVAIAATNVFAASGLYPQYTIPTSSFHAALARERVITLNSQEYPYAEDLLQGPAHPYMWMFNQSADEIWGATSELICKTLAGRPASHAGTALATTARKFGIIVTTNVTATLPVSMQPRLLTDRLEGCGADFVQQTINGTGPNDYRQAGEKLKAEGVTTVLCACDEGLTKMISLGSALGWEPEILLPVLGYTAEREESFLQYPGYKTWARHIFGVFPTARSLPWQVRPAYGAIRSVLPGYALKAGGSAFQRMEKLYSELLILASGIQGAGPKLTPDTFAQALMTMQFPNTGAGRAPYWQPSAGFGPGDHTMIDDFALAYWDPSRPSETVRADPGAVGAWCYIADGSRFAPGTIPADADSRFFNPAEPCG